MTQYIDKDTLVAEIERISNEFEYLCDSYDEGTGFQHALTLVKESLGTLEVKEVDLEKEIELWMKSNVDDAGYFNTLEFAKYCFELGIQTSKIG